jgi:hypothetical protein
MGAAVARRCEEVFDGLEGRTGHITKMGARTVLTSKSSSILPVSNGACPSSGGKLLLPERNTHPFRALTTKHPFCRHFESNYWIHHIDSYQNSSELAC